ncbi:MAG TPA: di-heme-cytochrome C peroxidase [Terriglobia bacterium]|nr:di-heme-cytochrome C peroxidase [Terriglobia bacterium]
MHAGKKVYLLLVMVLALTQGCGAPAQPPPPPDLKPVTFSENAMTPAERTEFYHLPEGSELFPLSWILYMESPKTKRPFIENLERFGLIPDPEGPMFEGTSIHVPVGVTIKEREGAAALRPLGLSRMVGVNCAACHVGQIEYGGKSLRIDGAPNMFDIVGFLSEIKETAESTYKSPSKLWAYLRAKIKAGKTTAETATLDAAREYDALRQGSSENKAVAAELETIAGQPDVDQADVDRIKNDRTQPDKVRVTFGDIAEEIRLMKSYLTMLGNLGGAQNPETVAGFGRADAFGTARLLLFGKANARPLSGPSSFPYIWNMNKTAWFHWPSNTNSVMQRNIGQALGLGASFVPTTGESSIDMYSLFRMEQLAYKTRPPAWPKEVFGEIDKEKADRGERIYRGMDVYAETGNCTRCHDSGKPYADDPNLTAYTIIPLHIVGTDDAEAKNWAVPVNVEGRLLGENKPFVTMDFGAAQAVFLDRIQKKGMADLKRARPDLDLERVEWESGRKAKPVWRVAYANAQTKEFGYPAKPLAGIWATAPYLHNGSVPTLADMLSPEQRPQAFALGTREYDAKKLGYRTDQIGWTYDTRKTGNSNAGHVFGSTLKPEEKEDLLEFLKTLGS